jgi:hypothetical protein
MLDNGGYRHGDRSPRRREAETFALLRAGHGATHRDRVSFADQVAQLAPHVGQRLEHPPASLPVALAPERQTGFMTLAL